MQTIDINNLTEVFKTCLSEQLAAEKKYIKALEKLPKVLLTDELKSAISPQATDIESHISRLSRALEAVKQKPQAAISSIDEELLNMLKAATGKGTSLMKDIQMMQTLKLIFTVKVSRYESLYQMAAALGHEEYAPLLEQCSKDNQNTFAYLNQVAQNVIYPELQKTA
ncbi:Ferritin-like metal-binding protein YciE [Pedobacter westerhofensis]|uniref:Ferritin-like metal-binding protein YciE n=1 Tax=Pedobacter westerhofensis TaxID=425512 RepID=A0A521CVM6_9SPHI|nr:DUF892 family protein [Pedobacter westerhofensis]SMO63478.1 Ferritin-like metal-binding protein YciE [Pedobacter westerhofensis]